MASSPFQRHGFILKNGIIDCACHMRMVSKLGCIRCIVKPQKAPEEAVWLSSEGSACAGHQVKSRSKTFSSSHWRWESTSGLTRIMLYFENTAFGSIPGFLKAV